MPKKLTRRSILPAKVPASKRYEYIKKTEDGVPSIRAYAEVIDKTIYDADPVNAAARIQYLKTAWKDYEEIKEMGLAEREEWNLKRSAALQDKAMSLLCNTLDRANEIISKPDVDMKEFNSAIQALKTIMPAMAKRPEPAKDKTIDYNAARFIN